MAKTYIEWASCKAVNWQYWEFFNISLNIEKLQQYVNEKGYVNVTMSKRREPWQYWDTHYFTLNEWTPQNSSANPSNETGSSSSPNSEEISIENIPF
jgi:hypothetical protein